MIVVGAAAMWLWLVLRVDGRAEERAADADEPLAGGPRRAHGDAATAARSRLAPTIAVVVLGVVAFTLLVARLMVNVF